MLWIPLKFSAKGNRFFLLTTLEFSNFAASFVWRGGQS